MKVSTLRNLPFGEYLLCKKSWLSNEIHTPIRLTKQPTNDNGSIYSLRTVGSLGFHSDLTLFDDSEEDEDHYYNGIVYKTLSAMMSNSIGLSLHVRHWTDCYELEFVSRFDNETWKINFDRYRIANKSNHKTRKEVKP